MKKERSEGDLLLGGHEVDVWLREFVEDFERCFDGNGYDWRMTYSRMVHISLSSESDFDRRDSMEISCDVDFEGGDDDHSQSSYSEVRNFYDKLKTKIKNDVKREVVDRARKEYNGMNDAIHLTLRMYATWNGSHFDSGLDFYNL